MKQKDKQNISQLEKKLKAEQEARSFVEKQLMEEKKRKKLEEATAARAVAFAAASRYVDVTWVLNPRLAFLGLRMGIWCLGQDWKYTIMHGWIAFKYCFISWFKPHLCKLMLSWQLHPSVTCCLKWDEGISMPPTPGRQNCAQKGISSHFL